MQIMTEFVDSNFATDQGLKDLGTEIRSEINDLRHELIQMESRLVVRLGTIHSGNCFTRCDDEALLRGDKR